MGSQLSEDNEWHLIIPCDSIIPSATGWKEAILELSVLQMNAAQ